jgi:hypothetical protein
MKPSLSTILRWAIPISLATAAIAYSFYRWREIQYWDGAVGNWLATLLGIVTGVPVALHLERVRNAAEETNRKVEVERIRKDTLTLLMKELVDARLSATVRLRMTDSIPIEPMKMSIWSAMREGGNLVHISEPKLLGAISDAYRMIALVSERERHIMTVVYGVNVQFPDGQYAGQKLLQETAGFHDPLLNVINRAIATISKELEGNSTATPCEA